MEFGHVTADGLDIGEETAVSYKNYSMAEPQAESCAETNEPMIDYQKIGAKRLDELFSREQFCSMADVFDNLSKQFKEQINVSYLIST